MNLKQDKKTGIFHSWKVPVLLKIYNCCPKVVLKSFIQKNKHTLKIKNVPVLRYF